MATSNEGLKLNGDVQTHYNDIMKLKCAATPWKLFTFGEEDKSTLFFLEEGSSLNDFKANLSSDKVIFGLLRIADNKPANLKGKLILVYWCGSNSEQEMIEESEQQYKRDGEAVFSKCDRFIAIKSQEELETKLRVILTSKEHKRIGSETKRSSTYDELNGKKKKSFVSKRKEKIKETQKFMDSTRDSVGTDYGSGDELEIPTPIEPGKFSVQKLLTHVRYLNICSEKSFGRDTQERYVK